MQPRTYKDNFYEYHLQGALSSAGAVIPVVKEYVNPNSVIDIGCGIGAWLSVWEKNGVKEIKGVDGAYVDKSKLLIHQNSFEECNLENGYKDTRKYDLVSCLEVAEHLPAQSAELFVESLCALGDVILFSAAIPAQEGTMHINEQYPEYWENIFRKKGYLAIDCLRPLIWDNPKIEWWYRQNIMFFVKKSVSGNYPKLKSAAINNDGKVMSLVHPEMLKEKWKKITYYETILHSKKATLKYLLDSLFGKKKG
jgi:hypothetical protein